jgi:hypothetical protein
MSEMEKMGMGVGQKRRGRPVQEPTPTAITQAQQRAPRVELSTSNETFNLIARSLLNVSDQIPALVRDTAELKVSDVEIKSLIWQLTNSITSIQNAIQGLASDVAFIANTMNEVLPQGKPRIKLAEAPGEAMPTILSKLAADPNNR